MAVIPISSKQSRVPGGCLALFFSVFLLAGLGFLYFAFLKPVWRSWEARDWVEVPCTILSSEVESRRSDDGTTYRVKISYRYFIGDDEHVSSRYEFMEMSTSGQSGKRAIVRRYPPGREAVCYVDPDDPAEAVMERGLTGALWFGLIPLVFVVIGGGGIIFSLRTPRPGSERGPSSGVGGRRRFGGRGAADGGSVGPVNLKPRATPVMRFIGYTCLALFWNGIVSVFAWQVIKAWTTGRGSWMERWFLPIFLIPFVLVGLVLIALALHSLLGIFNPRPRLTAGSASVQLGGLLELSWMIQGRAGKLKKLRIVVEGREEAVYRRGTSTHTDRHVFKVIEAASLTSVSEIRAGRVEVRIPADTMHSFETPNNKIIWSIKLTGEIPKWPDVDAEYPLAVRAAGLGEGVGA